MAIDLILLSIKEWLLSGQARVYSVIASTYRLRLEDLKPTLIRKWLAKEISIPEEKINLSSLNSAMARRRKKDQKNKLNEKNNSSVTHATAPTDRNENFTFQQSKMLLQKKEPRNYN